MGYYTKDHEEAAKEKFDKKIEREVRKEERSEKSQAAQASGHNNVDDCFFNTMEFMCYMLSCCGCGTSYSDWYYDHLGSYPPDCCGHECCC